MKCFNGRIDLPIPFLEDPEDPVPFTYKGVKLWYTPPVHPWGESINAMRYDAEINIFYGSDVFAYLDFKREYWYLCTEATRYGGFSKLAKFRGSVNDALDKLIAVLVTEKLKGGADE